MSGNPEFGKRIRDLREKKREADSSFSLRQFAAKVGISPTFLSKIENGEFDPPSAENIKKMAALLDCNADELLALAGKVDPDISEIIRKKPKALADFLRVASGRSEDEIRKMTAQMVNPAKEEEKEK
jgi:transcriptional regulator with XRE-family HTH domain